MGVAVVPELFDLGPVLAAPVSDAERSRRVRLAAVLAQHPVDPADVGAVLDAIDAWHERDAAATGLALHAYLGWTWQQYKAWAETDRRISPDEARWSPEQGL